MNEWIWKKNTARCASKKNEKKKSPSAPPDSHLKCSKLKSYFCSFGLYLSDTTLTCDNFILAAQPLFFHLFFTLSVRSYALSAHLQRNKFSLKIYYDYMNTKKCFKCIRNVMRIRRRENHYSFFTIWGVHTSTQENRVMQVHSMHIQKKKTFLLEKKWEYLAIIPCWLLTY